MDKGKIMRAVIMAAIAMAVAACASIGRPEGGPKDETPPVYVRSTPAPGTKNFTRTTIDIYFDENIKLDDPSNKIVVSPAQQMMPQISANGRHLTMTLRDSLLPDQTYTLDFSDAIRDLNEGNILDGFVIDFSTGDSIDSLRISGMVLEAQTLEPAQGMIVGAYRNLSDSAIRTIKVERICKTNQLGQFTLRNLKNEVYRLFAINDVNRDFHWDRSEDVAFYNAPVKPWAEHITVTDTLRAFDGTDSIVDRAGIKFLPNDILLTWFNENYSPLYMKDHSRNQRNIIRLEFSAPVDSLPVLTIVNGENQGKIIGDFARLARSVKNDTLEYWITDSAIIMQDSLLIETRYLRTDTNELITWTADTIRYIYRTPKSVENDLKKKAEEREKKERKRLEAIEKWKQTGDSSLIKDTIPEPEPVEYLQIKAATSSTQDYHRPVRLSVSEPLRSWDISATKLEMMEDSTWITIENFELNEDSTGKIMEYVLESPWEFETQYRFTVDSAAVVSIYDKWNKGFKHEFKVKGPEEYSTLIFDIPAVAYNPEVPFDWESLNDSLYAATDTLSKIPGTENLLDSIDKIEGLLGTDSLQIELPEVMGEITADSLTTISPQEVARSPQIVVELLSTNETVIARAPLVDGKARFEFLSPATYYARAFIDFNGNGEWDTGNIEEWRQPEDMYYYPKKISLKQNWDMSQTWDLYELPLDVQKPLEIKKNKPKTKERQSRNEDEDEEEEFGTNYFYQPGNTYGNAGNNYNNTNNNRNNRTANGFRTAR